MNSYGGYLELRHEATRLTLDPRRGGSIRAFDWRDLPVLRSTPAAAGDDPFDTACFPMVPYANRIARGWFRCGERLVQLAPNWSADPHPLHGQGWRAAWAVAAAGPASARLRFDGGGDEWPWRYRCEQDFELRPGALEVELSVENLSGTPMPAMLGLHPYFCGAAHAQLQAHLPRVWLTDAASLPVEQVATPAGWGFEPGRAIHGVALDHCFAGWDGVATLRWPDRRVTLRASNCGCLQIYAPPAQDYFCVEPQSARSGAIGAATAEAALLAPGERFAIRVQFDVGAG